MLLEKEYKLFEQNKDRLAANNLGEFVLIHDDNIIETFVSYEDALKFGLKQFGNVPFLIKKIEREESISYFYSGIAL